MSDRRGSILIVDDEFSMRDSLTNWFLEDGHDVMSAASGEEALRVLQGRSFDVALLDIKMPGMDGMELMERIHKLNPNIQIVMITAFAAVDTAVRALKEGALDYVTKPVDPENLSQVVARAIEVVRVRERVAAGEGLPGETTAGDAIIGESPAIQRVRALIAQVAQTGATVLIRGESGTGKELIARAIHAASPRRYFSLIPVNCGALTETLLESELFGHEKGAFTGAQFRRKGKLEMADGGTLFLDEVATLSPKSQVDLLRVLETKEFTRLGGNQTVKVDFRVVCATNEDLEQLVREKLFREDLYYRINVFRIDAPPLRERLSDVPILARHFIHKLALQMNKKVDDLAPDAVAALQGHPWPGNVRQLANSLERALIVTTGPLVRASDLGLDLPMDGGGERKGASAPVTSVPPGAVAPAGGGASGGSLDEMEMLHIRRVLEQENWNITRAASLLKVDRNTLYSKIKKYGLRR